MSNSEPALEPIALRIPRRRGDHKETQPPHGCGGEDEDDD